MMVGTIAERLDVEKRVASGRADLRVRRQDITWRNVTPDVVRIEVTIHNVGTEASEPTQLTIESAPFGAFLSWTPLTTVDVPPVLSDFGRVTVSTMAAVPRLDVQGDLGRVPPRTLLTAAGLDGEERPEQKRRRRPPTLAPDLLTRLGGGSVHWAGNLNVFIGEQTVERHRARALRVYPGRTNVAAFFCGEQRDAYRFELEGDAAAWDARLSGGPTWRGLLSARPDLTSRAGELEEDTWVDLPARGIVMLSVTPPEDATSGHVDVHVRQRSTGKDAVVEFSMDAGASGPGCYVV